MEIYKNFKVYGPYKSKQDKRLRVILKNGNIRKTISYPKYLVEIKLNRYLDKDETIDHIDGNFLNNDLSNLRIIKRSEHSKQDVFRNKDVIIHCSWCKKEFTIKGNLLRYRNRKKCKSSGFCSKLCTGKYAKHIQTGGKSFNKIKIDKVKYKLKSAMKVTSLVEEENIGESLTGNTEA